MSSQLRGVPGSSGADGFSMFISYQEFRGVFLIVAKQRFSAEQKRHNPEFAVCAAIAS